MEGFILAGGQSSRMGTPKADLVLGGMTLLERAVATISEFTAGNVSAIVESSYKPADVSGVRFATDAPFAGLAAQQRAPILGLYTALEISTTEWILLLAVDLPFISRGVLDQLFSRCTKDVDAVVPIQPDGRRQPLCAFYRCSACRHAVCEVLAGDDLSFHALFRRLRVTEVAYAEYRDLVDCEHLFLNINTPDELESARRLV